MVGSGPTSGAAPETSPEGVPEVLLISAIPMGMVTGRLDSQSGWVRGSMRSITRRMVEPVTC